MSDELTQSERQELVRLRWLVLRIHENWSRAYLKRGFPVLDAYIAGACGVVFHEVQIQCDAEMHTNYAPNLKGELDNLWDQYKAGVQEQNYLTAWETRHGK